MHVNKLRLALVAQSLAALLLPLAADAHDMQVLWRAQMATPAPMAWKPREHGGVVLSPHGTWLYAASATGLRAYVAGTGEELWTALTTERIDSRPVVDNGELAARQTVEQRGLAHVGASDNSELQRHARLLARIAGFA